MSSATNIPIVVLDNGMKTFIKMKSIKMGLQIPTPIVYIDLIKDKADGKNIPEKVYVDNLDLIIEDILNIKVSVATIDNETITRQFYGCST